ncbi:MAG TPA: TolC family protein [Candidatus Barnesiella excrementigallinarum]|nr:TolC family protein [Candidatus Barnesiella excrementigallinarum]
MKRAVVLAIGFWLGVVAMSAQLTLDECRQLAREHYPEIRQYDLIRKSESYNLSNAGRAWIPQLVLSAQATWQTDVPQFPDVLTGMLSQQGVEIPGLQQDQYKVALELNQPIWDGGKSAADRHIARAEAAEQRTAADVELYALDGRVDELYFGILLLDERIAQTKLTQELLQSNLAKVEALQRNGVAMQSDADALEAELLTVGQQLGQFEASRESYRRMLGIFIGQELGDRTLLKPELVEPLAGENARPELAMFAAKIDRLTAQEKLVKSSSMPRLGFFAQGYYGYPGLDFMQGMMNNDWSWNALLGVKLSWNFGAYYTQKNNLNKLRTSRKQVEVQRDIFLFNMALQTAQDNGNIARLRRALADDDRIVALRRSVREAAESKLRNGVIDTHDLLTKITEESAAAMARSMREIELLKTIYELKHTINR